MVVKPLPLPQRLRSGPLFGTLIVSESPRWLDVVGHCGLDFVFIDTEHVALDRGSVAWMCQSYARAGLPPLVRIPSPDPYSATMVLDGGAAGVVAPYVETVEQVRALRGAVKLRPVKGLKLQGLLAGERASRPLDDYLARSARERALIINIESVPALENLEALVAEPGVDGVLIGPHDLSCSLEVPEQYDHPRFKAAVKRIFQTARQAGIGAGIHLFGRSVAQSREVIGWGATFYIHWSDIQLFSHHLAAEVAQLRGSTARGKQAGRVRAEAI